MYLGDNFIVGGIAALVDEFRSARPDAQILLTAVPDARRFGVAELDDAGEVVGLQEKPRQPKSDLALVGVYIFTPAVHEAVRQLTPSGRGELEITEALQWLIDDGRKVRSTIISGYWKDTGNVADMLEVNRMMLESVETSQLGVVDSETELIGRVAIGCGARVSRSRIVGPAIIGARLVLAEAAVKTHVGRMLSKLQLRDRIQAVVYATSTVWSARGRAPDGVTRISDILENALGNGGEHSPGASAMRCRAGPLGPALQRLLIYSWVVTAFTSV